MLISYAKYYGYPSNLAEQPGIMIIDEIDAHLHPTAQQRIIPTLRRHFPQMQIFCSTHSPLCWSISSLGKSSFCNVIAMAQ